MRAHVERLRGALERLDAEACSDNISTHDGWHKTEPRLELPRDVRLLVDEALAATPAQSLAAYRAQVLEEAAALVETWGAHPPSPLGRRAKIAEALRAKARESGPVMPPAFWSKD